MSESELFEESGPVVETEDGFAPSEQHLEPDIDSEVDFDDEEYEYAELIDEKEAGNAEGDQDAHLDDPARAADDDTW
jgi:hypothetical protein